MSRDPFLTLELAPGRYAPEYIDARCALLRQRLCRKLADPAECADALRELDRLHVARGLLRDPDRQAAYLRARSTGDCAATLRALIAESLEGGLLRHSRRQEILSAARESGVSEFHAHLLIAQVQFGGEPQFELLPAAERRTALPLRPLATRLAAAGVLAAAMFLVLVFLAAP